MLPSSNLSCTALSNHLSPCDQRLPVTKSHSQPKSPESELPTMVLGYFGFGHIIYVSLLLTNAIAILNEERFLAKSEHALKRYQCVLR